MCGGTLHSATPELVGSLLVDVPRQHSGLAVGQQASPELIDLPVHDGTERLGSLFKDLPRFVEPQAGQQVGATCLELSHDGVGGLQHLSPAAQARTLREHPFRPLTQIGERSRLEQVFAGTPSGEREVVADTARVDALAVCDVVGKGADRRKGAQRVCAACELVEVGRDGDGAGASWRRRLG